MKKIISFLIIYLLSFSALAIDISSPEDETKMTGGEDNDNSNFKNTATVRALNKSTAKSSVLELPLKQKTKFGSLNITTHKCWQAPLDQRPESKVLIEISEDKIIDGKTEPSQIFYGWMFASSPSISSMEHSIYDINVLSCR